MAVKMSAEDRFKAAVQIIRSLPKNGSFQPAYAMQLSFYSHYKQATAGPCNGARPSFWDVVGRAKYDAWQKLGTMGKEVAMQNYVAEFVATIKKLQANASPEEVQEALSYAEPEHIALLKPLFEDGPPAGSKEKLPAELQDSRSSPSEDDIEKIEANIDSEEEYSDTFNNIEDDRHSSEQADIVNAQAVQYKNLRNSVGQRQDDGRFVKAGGGDVRDGGPPPPAGYYVTSNSEAFLHSNRSYSGDLYAHGNAARIAGGARQPPNHPVGYVQPVDNLSYAVVRLQYTMDEVVRRLEKLELTLHEQRSRRWSFFGGTQPHIFAAILGWPLLLQLILYLIRRRRLRLQLRLK